MRYRHLGASGLRVPELSPDTGTFGGSGPLFGEWGTTGPEQARQPVDRCLDAGVPPFDSADASSGGAAEEVLAQALRGRPCASGAVRTAPAARTAGGRGAAPRRG